MSLINHQEKILHLKVVYVGPGLSGKTTNIQYIYENTATDLRGKLFSGMSENERTLFFDFLPFGIGDTRGYQTRFHIFSVPGQTFYEISQQFILRGIDGIIFVADSQPERMEANIDAFENLTKNLERQGYDLNKIPMVFQYNKRDVPNPIPIRELESTFNPMRRPYFEAVASRGEGVMETLQAVSQWIIREIKGGENP